MSTLICNSPIVKECKNHGFKTESECRVRNRKLADGNQTKHYECKECANETKKKWLLKNPKKNRDYKFKDWPLIIGSGPLKCVTCTLEKEQIQFHKHMLKNSNPRCKVCMKICLKKYKENNKESYLKTQKKHREKNKDHYSNMAHENKLRVYFDMTADEFNEILLKQNNVCAICKNIETRKNSNGTLCRLSVDHCHQTGVIRGLLCNNCNLTLGRFNHDPSILKSAIDYLNGQGYKRP